MSSRSLKMMICVITTVVVGLFLPLASASVRSKAADAGSRVMNALGVTLAVQAAPDEVSYVERGRIWPQLRDGLRTIGDRTESPGKERQTLAGSLTRKGERAMSVIVVLEYLDHVRVENPTTGIVVGYDGVNAWRSDDSLELEDLAMIETLAFDCADHFFARQMDTASTRYLGGRFRLDDGESETYSDPYYDLYELSERVEIGSSKRDAVKVYAFDSDTQLLGRITYQSETGASVEIIVSGWEIVGDQMLPSHVERFEDGTSVLSFDIGSAVVSPRADDRIFDPVP